MAGARITFEFQHKAFTEALARLDISDPARRYKILNSIRGGLARNTRDRFTSGLDPQGKAWAPLNPAYAASRRQPRPILQQLGISGGLLSSIVSSIEGDRIIVGSNKQYAAVHQFGAVIRPKTARALAFQLGGHLILARSVTIPARPYLGFGPADEIVVINAIDVLLPGGR